jgi:DNA-binding transcriptional MocR family regulator
MAPPLMTGLACEWLRSGLAGEIAAAVRTEAQARQEIARSILPKGFVASESGLHLWYPLESQLRSAELADIARRRRLAISPAEEFAVGQEFPNGFRLALGATPNRERLKEGLESLASILSGAPDSSRPKV